MNDLISNQQILQQMIERETGNLYENLRGEILNIVGKNPAIKTVASNYIKAYEPKILASLQEKVDLIVATSFPTPETTLEDAIINANSTINATIGGWLEEKLGIPMETLNIALQALLGT